MNRPGKKGRPPSIDAREMKAQGISSATEITKASASAGRVSAGCWKPAGDCRGRPGMTHRPEPNGPMTLGNMRRNGVRGLDVTCRARGHRTGVNVDAWPDDVPVSSFGPRMRCSHRGSVPLDLAVHTMYPIPGKSRMLLPCQREEEQ
jgi:hypothetical protein